MVSLVRPVTLFVQVLFPSVALLVAVLVLVGWWLQIPALVQLNPHLAPMQFNTALCFVALSLGVLCAGMRLWRRIVVLCACVSLGLAATSILQYPLHADFGIDTVFVEPFVTTLTSHPGRMAPNTGLGFIFSSLVLLLWPTTPKEWRLFVAATGAFVSLSLALSGLFRYALQLETIYSWSDLTRMAVHTAMLHSVLALALLFHVNTRLEESGRSQYRFQAVGIFGVGAVISGLLFLAALTDESKELRASLKEGTLVRRAAIQDAVDSNVRLLLATERFFAGSNFVSRDEFQTFVLPLFEHDTSLAAFDWAPRMTSQDRTALEKELAPFTGTGLSILDVDHGFILHPGADTYYPVRYVVPEAYRHHVLGFDYYADPQSALAMDNAARIGEPQSTNPMRSILPEAEKGSRDEISIFVPSYLSGKPAQTVTSAQDSQVRGFVVGILRLSHLISQALADFPRDAFHMAVYAHSSEFGTFDTQPVVLLGATRGEVAPVSPRDRAAEIIQIAGKPLLIEFWPTASFLDRHRSFAPSAIFFVSLAVTFFTSSYIYVLRRNREVLHERELRLRMAMEGAELGTWDWYPQSHVTSFDNRWFTMLGYDPAEMGPHETIWEQLVHADDKENVWAALEEHYTGKTSIYRSAYRLRGKDGEWVWVLSAGQVINRDGTGRPTRMVGIHLDITQLKQAQLEASHAQQQLASFIEHAPAAVAMLDTELRYITYSQRWLYDYGLAGRQIVGLSHDEVLPDTAEHWRAIHQRCLQGAVEKCEEEAFVRADGTCQWLRWEVRPWFDINGEIGGVAMFTEDITHTRALIAELEITRDQALAATQAKSDFLASMSHEIRTPMNAIFGMAELLGETPLTPEQQDYVQRLRKAGEHLLVLINDVLDLSKIESGHLELDHIPFDLDELVHAVGELMAGRATAQGLELLVDVAPDVPTSLIGDPSRLRQILINLIGNAIKFTPAGEVVVDVENDPEAPQPGRLRFSVRDTGIGIPADKLHTIFESFTQVDASTTRQYGGTGLGLSISQHLVRLMDGHIAAESQLGKGSTFTFTAQFALDAAPQEQVMALAVEIHGLRILVVDDNATNRLIVRDMLQYYGAVVTEADGAEAGLAAWAAAQRDQQPFHIALVDCQMPGKDGFYFIEQVTSVPGRDLPAMFMLSSDNRPGDRARCQSLGVRQYLLKPLSRRSLLYAITGSFNQHDSAPQPQMQSLASPTVAAGRALHILVAEDNEDNQMLIQSYLMKTPHQLTLAENGAVAVEKFEAGAYDLVLMDVQMPVMDGYRATATMRQWEQEHNRMPVRIIALTANALSEDIQKSLAAGCDSHLTKPIKKATLLAAIEEVASSLALST